MHGNYVLNKSSVNTTQMSSTRCVHVYGNSVVFVPIIHFVYCSQYIYIYIHPYVISNPRQYIYHEMLVHVQYCILTFSLRKIYDFIVLLIYHIIFALLTKGTLSGIEIKKQIIINLMKSCNPQHAFIIEEMYH